MYHLYTQDNGFEYYILNDELERDRLIMRQLVNGHKRYKTYRPFKSYLSAERVLNRKLLNTTIPVISKNSLSLPSILHEHMPKRKNGIITIPEVWNVYNYMSFYNEEFKYYAFVYSKRDNNLKDKLYYFIKFSTPVPTIKLDLFGITSFANYFPGSTLLVPNYPVAKAFEKGWVTEWVKNDIRVQDRELWANTLRTLNRKPRTRAVYGSPDIDLAQSYYRNAIEFDVFRTRYADLERINSVAFNRLTHNYHTLAKVPDMCMIESINVMTKHSLPTDMSTTHKIPRE